MILFVIIAFILAWFFIEITLFFSNKNSNEKNDINTISYIKFIWYLRLIAIALLLLTFIYMNYFGDLDIGEVIQYCLGIINR
tara:strand:+ start:400 stop:645 length:246 start_codon:yes stop_codon:yes gene_type:complete